MKKRRIKRISQKRAIEIEQEAKLRQELWVEQKGLCPDCGNPLDWRYAKHEKEFRSHGGSPIEKDNCVLLCGKCHSARHGIKEVQSEPQWSRDERPL